MYVKSIVLDGFKSYGQRTEISGFDEQFNAITGLNGSGKSNVLDAICFVLGISNLTQVRASNLQDLIYKSGQAGVNKATVSITFDNTNPEQCPPTFERVSEITITRQIVIGGKNKYMINGTTVQNKKVQDLFCSIQLNVNNPHFLIMQGKVTKVLNMKPCDILAMIEEAAGTKMYETKKQSAQKTIVKKDAKLKELDAIVKEEITPKLDKLRKERALYVEYRTVEREIEQMLGIYQAWEYLYSQKAVIKAAQILEKGQGKIHSIEENIKKNQERIQQIDEDIEELQSNATSEASEALKKVEAELKETEKVEAKATSKLKSIQDNITKEERKKVQLEKNLVDDSKALKSKEDELGKVQALFETLKENQRADAAALALSEKKFEALSTGMEVNEAGEAETLRDQLMKLQQEAAQARTNVNTATGRIEFCQKSLKEKQRGLGSNAADYERNRVDLEKLQKEVKSLETSLGKVNYSEERMNELEKNRQNGTQEFRMLKDRTERFEAQRPQTQFRYTDPEPNFQRQRVHGVVCRLIDVKDPIANMAIETAAGGRLYNVVIDSDVTGKKLLQRGNLQNRTTFIPLNKIQSNAMSNSIINKAQRLVGEENVQPAIAHLNYEPRHQRVMDFIFGNVFVCRDINTAKQVAFHPQIQRKCVTLDGDVVDPAGTLSGGAPQKGGSVLAQLKEILQFEEQLQMKERDINNIAEEIRKMSVFQDQYATLKQKLEMKLQDVNLLTQRLQQTKHHRMQEEIDNLASEIAELKEKIQKCQAVEAESKQKIKELESKMKNTNKDNQLKEAENEMKKLRQKADKSKKEWDNKEKAYDALNMEIEVLKKELEKLKEQIQACEDAIKELKEQHAEESKNTKEIKDSVKRLQAQVKAGKAAIAEKNKDIQKRVQQKEELTAQITEFNLKIKEHNHELKKLNDDVKNLQAKEQDCRKRIKKDNAYLKDAEKMSDEEGRNLEKKIRANQEKKNKLSRTVNAKAQSMFEQEEQQYNDLRRKQKIVQEDKIKIISVIADLDKKKEHILSVAYEQISKDFGSIFSTLLPGANAKLLPPPGQTILQGLEVKVSLGGVWKESLTELSGGQRSLAALSLILAMLLFKPAPLYILDEVDAALDLSHTQNIGNMLKSHFKKSQFIIVSLKDGMFNNANVLFRTKFVDGVSTISRTVNKN